MKAKAYPSCKEFPCESISCDGANILREIEVEIPTADLIAELERRRPCKKCVTQSDMRCVSCVWSAVYSMNKKDNFTPKSEEVK